MVIATKLQVVSAGKKKKKNVGLLRMARFNGRQRSKMDCKCILA